MRTLRSLSGAALAALTLLGLAGCEASERSSSTPPWVRQEMTRASDHDRCADGSGQIGAFGLQSCLRIGGNTGDGSLMSAGLPARGGGPAPALQPTIAPTPTTTEGETCPNAHPRAGYGTRICSP
jgi:hypothetical protein